MYTSGHEGLELPVVLYNNLYNNNYIIHVDMIVYIVISHHYYTSHHYNDYLAILRYSKCVANPLKFDTVLHYGTMFHGGDGSPYISLCFLSA